MRVLWLTFIPSPYRLRFFEELAKRCDLTVLFERENSKIRGSHWDGFQFNGYTGIILKGVTVGGFDKFCPGVVKYLNDSYDRIVISNPTSPTGIYAAAILQSQKIDYFVESDGAFPTHQKGIKMALKRFVMRKASVCFSTAAVHDQYYMECGVEPERIKRYPFTSIGEEDIRNAKQLQDGDRQYFEAQTAEHLTNEVLHREMIREGAKARLKIANKKMILAIGQFVPRKGFDVLLRSLKPLGETVCTYLIGGSPTPEYEHICRENNLQDVHFLDFLDKQQLQDYFRAADVFVLPTREDVWGLVINEAMAYALPIITTNQCVAGLELLSENCGFVINADDTQSLTDALNRVLADSALANQMGINGQKRIEDYTFEAMAECHFDAFR